MSRKMLAVAAFALMAPIAMAQAQIIPKLGIAGGATLPTGDLKDHAESGYHGLVTLSIHPPLSPVGFRVDGLFTQMNGTTTSDPKMRIIGANANAILSMPGVPLLISPYLIGGVGMYSTKSTLGSVSTSSSDPAVNVGVGLKFGLAGFGAFGEVRYHAVMSDAATKVRFIPITFGISM